MPQDQEDSRDSSLNLQFTDPDPSIAMDPPLVKARSAASQERALGIAQGDAHLLVSQDVSEAFSESPRDSNRKLGRRTRG